MPILASAGALPMWRLDAAPALVGAIGIGLLMSTQFLFQVFVWTQWPWDGPCSARWPARPH